MIASASPCQVHVLLSLGLSHAGDPQSCKLVPARLIHGSHQSPYTALARGCLETELLADWVVVKAGMYGALQEVAEGPAEALAAGNGLVGWGMAPEGIEQNPIVYSAMSEWAFRCMLPLVLYQASCCLPGRADMQPSSPRTMQLVKAALHDWLADHLHRAAEFYAEKLPAGIVMAAPLLTSGSQHNHNPEPKP